MKNNLSDNIAKKGTEKKLTKFKSVLLNDNRKKFFGTYGYLLLAGAIPALLMLLIYIARGLYPFGDGCVLVLDLNGQYVYFYEALRSFIYGEGSLLYSFSRALGGEFLGIYDYYIASPFSWLVGLFPEDGMLGALLFIFLIKMGISGLTMGFYLHRHSNGAPNKLAVIAFSVMYAMTSYAVVQQHNSMWIDALMWLPLLTYGIEELIKHGKFRLFVFIFALILLSNFYIGYMVAIYTIAYSFYYYFAHNANNENNPLGEKNHFARSVIRVAAWSILAVGIAAIAILSAKYSLAFGKNEFSSPDWSITQKFDLFDLLYKFLPSSYDTVRPEGLPQVYCGVLTIMLVPTFFMSKKFSNRNKIAAAAFITFFIGSFVISSIDLIWHGFQKPNWLNYRYSFMLCFFLIFLAYKAFEKIEYLSRKALLLTVSFIGLFVLILQKMGDYITELNEKIVIAPWATVGLTLACLLIYFVIICLSGSSSSKRNRELLAMIMTFVVCLEVFFSGLSDINDFDSDVTFSKYSRYNNEFIDVFRPIADTVQKYDHSFYRMEKNYHRKTNDNMALNMKGLSLSTSTLNRNTITYLQEMGYSSKSHWSKYLGGTPVNDSLLGIKYLISDYDWSEYYGEPIFTYEDYNYPDGFDPKNYNVYLNPYALSLAFGISDDYLEYDIEKYDSPFDRINAMVTAMLGDDELVQIFVPATMTDGPVTENLKSEFIAASRTADKIEEMKYSVSDKSKASSLTYTYTVPTGTQLFYFNPTGYNREVKITINGNETANEPVTNLVHAFAGNETTRIVFLGAASKEDLTLKISLNGKFDGAQFSSTDFYTRERESYVYYIDMDVFEETFTRLAQTQLIIDEDYSDDDISGTLQTNRDSQLIYTSIPYDEGWNIYVDGKKVDIYENDHALISFRVDTAGTHDIRLKYMPATVLVGFICTGICTLIFVLVLVLYPILKRNSLFNKYVLITGEELPVQDTPESLACIDKGDIGEHCSSCEENIPQIKHRKRKK